jgi:hypothetical protein
LLPWAFEEAHQGGFSLDDIDVAAALENPIGNGHRSMLNHL